MKQINSTNHAINKYGTIEQVTCKDLDRDALFQLFRCGTKVVRLIKDDRVNQLWERLVCNNSGKASSSKACPQFWENNHLTLSRNHLESHTNVGDMLRFIPGQYGHIARKIVIYPDLNSGKMVYYPKLMQNDQREIVFDQYTLRMAWDLASQIYQSAAPADFEPENYEVTIDLLKYPDTNQDLKKIFALLGDSAGRWTRIGQRVDLAIASAQGVFDQRIIRNLYGWLSLSSRLGSWFKNLNGKLNTDDRYSINTDEVLVGSAHTDGIRSLSMLASDRDVIKTEVHDGTQWVELPMTTDSLAIFPGRAFDSKLGIPATLHRYTMKKNKPIHGENKLNLTLMLGIIKKGSALKK